MNSQTKPTYQQLVDTVKAYDKFIKSMICGIQFSKEQSDKIMELLNPLWGVDNIVAQCNEMDASDDNPVAEMDTPAAKGIQNYLENFDEHSFIDLLLRDLIDQEERRQSKNCPEVQPRHEIEQSIKEDLYSGCDPVSLAIMIVQALSYAAKGDTK